MKSASRDVRATGEPCQPNPPSADRDQQPDVVWLVALPAFAGLLALGYSLIGVAFSPLL